MRLWQARPVTLTGTGGTGKTRLAVKASARVVGGFLMGCGWPSCQYLAGAPGQAAESLRAALDIYEQQRATALAGQARTALVVLTAQPGRDPA